MTIIGDSALCIAFPERHMALWQRGPEAWRRAIQPLVSHPTVTRACGFAGLAFGFWLASRQFESDRSLQSAARHYTRELQHAVGSA